MTVGLDAICLIVGLLMYALATNGKVTEIGRIMFWVGLLALPLSGEQLRVLLNK